MRNISGLPSLYPPYTDAGALHAYFNPQGWRKSMEDAHITSVTLGDKANTAMFGVFDGHGGRYGESLPDSVRYGG